MEEKKKINSSDVSNRTLELCKQLAKVHIGDNDCLGKMANEIMNELSQNEIFNKNIDAEEKLLELFCESIYKEGKTKEEQYSDIKKILNIESFMKATNNNLDMLFKYMFSATEGIRLSNIQVGEFIKDEYGDDFFFRRETLRYEEYLREIRKT